MSQVWRGVVARAQSYTATGALEVAISHAAAVSSTARNVIINAITAWKKKHQS